MLGDDDEEPDEEDDDVEEGQDVGGDQKNFLNKKIKKSSTDVGLEEQLLAVVDDSPERASQEMPKQELSLENELKQFQLDSKDDSLSVIESQLREEEQGENKVYDLIISKVLNDPQIDKRILLQKFISKIEMESNMKSGLASELSQIKKLMEKESTDEPPPDQEVEE